MSYKNEGYCCPECDSEDILFIIFGDPKFFCQSCENQFGETKEKEEI